jgi:CheY-like chemotaxis protein
MPPSSTLPPQHLLLADDDEDDCLLFKDALEELPISTLLTAVHNGEHLMQLLNQKNEPLPDILFLDLNMPRKNGFQCLSEIKQNEKLKYLPVIIISTSIEQNIINLLYKNGAQHCLRKPNKFSMFKKLIHHAITLTAQENFAQPPREEFVLLHESYYNEIK